MSFHKRMHSSTRNQTGEEDSVDQDFFQEKKDNTVDQDFFQEKSELPRIQRFSHLTPFYQQLS